MEAVGLPVSKMYEKAKDEINIPIALLGTKVRDFGEKRWAGVQFVMRTWD